MIKKLLVLLALAIAQPIHAAAISVWVPGGDLSSSTTATNQVIANGAIDLSGGKVTGVLPLSRGGLSSALSDPGADRILFWDDTAGSVEWLSVDGTLDITGTALGVNGANLTGIPWSALSGVAYTDITALWNVGPACDSTTFLRGDGACIGAGGGGLGSVTSVGLSMPTGFSVAGSPVTTAGTLTVTTSLNGVLYGNGTGFTTATSSNVIALWSGTCNASSFLRGDGSCQAVTTTPAGSNTQVQFNNAGAFGASASLTWNGSTLAATSFTGSGSGLTGIPDGALSSNVALKNGTNAFTNTNSFGNVVTIGDSIVPDSNGARSVGTTSLRFGNLWGNNLNGIAVTDFARLSQSNVFTGTVQTASGTNARWQVTDGTAGGRLLVDGANGVYLETTTNHPLNFATNNAGRGGISAAGNWTMNAPSSGDALTVSGSTLFNPTLAAGTYSARILGASGAARDLLLVGQTGYSNGMTVGFNGTRMAYTFNDGAVVINGGASGTTGLTVNGANNNWTQTIEGGSTTSQSYGLRILAGTNASDYALAVNNKAGSTMMLVGGAGNVTISTPTSGVSLQAPDTRWTDGTRQMDAFVTSGGGYLGMNTSHALTLFAGGSTARGGEISANGNWTLFTPNSGNTLALSQISSQRALTFTDGTISGALQTSNSGAVILAALSAHPVDIYANTGSYNTRFLNGVQVGSPTGGDKGAGTINTSGAIYQNNVPLLVKSASGYCSSAGTGCANYYTTGGVSVTGSSNPGTGEIQVTFSGFTDPGSGLGVACTATSKRGVAQPSIVEYTSSSYTFANFTTRNSTTGAAMDQDFSFICTGT